MANPLKDRLIQDLKAFHDIEYFWRHQLAIDWLWPGQIEVLKSFYNPEKGYRELVLIAGMRGGKTTLVSVMACYEAFKLLALGTPFKHYGLPPDENIFITNVAVSAPQAKDTLFAAIKARIHNSPFFEEYGYKERYNEIVFRAQDGHIVIRSEHSNSASLAGKTSILVQLDELARFTDTGGRSSAEMVYYTVSRQTKTFGKDGKIAVLTSPLFQDDFAMQLYRLAKKDMKRPEPRMLGVLKPTWEMSAVLTFEELQSEFEKNPETAWRDYGATPSASIETYFKEPWKIDEAIDKKLRNIVDTKHGVLKKDVFGDPDKWYYLAGDPALKNDAFGMALIHRESDGIIADMVFHMVPSLWAGDHREVDATMVKQLVLEIASKYRVAGFVVDTWQFPETVQAIREKGVNVVQNVVTKEEYDYLKELIYEGRIKMPHYSPVVEELKQLEITRGAKITHRRDSSKDIADALANAVSAERNLVADMQPPIYVVVDL